MNELKNPCGVITIIECCDETMKNDNCAGCDNINWLSAFETESECNEAYKKQFPEKFDSDGNFKSEPDCNSNPRYQCEMFLNYGFEGCKDKCPNWY